MRANSGPLIAGWFGRRTGRRFAADLRWQKARGLVLALLVAGGCDSLSFTPPRPAELTAPAKSTAPVRPGASSPAPADSPAKAVAAKTPKARARLVELIVSQPPDVDRLYLEQFLRRDVGVQKFAFRSTKPEKDTPMSPEAVARAIRAAIDRGAGAIIIEAIDAPEVREALREAESQGIAIVLLDVAVPSSSPGKPYPRIVFKGFEEKGRRLVEGALEEARLLRFPADGTIAIVRSKRKDPYSDQRFESIIVPLKQAGRKFEVIEIEAENKQSALVTAFLNAHPDTIILLYDEDYGLAAAHEARRKWVEAGHREIILAGYTACDIRLDILVKSKSSAMVDRNIEGYTRKALQLALDQIDGKSVPDILEVEMPFLRNRRISYPTGGEPGKTEAGAQDPVTVPPK